MNPNEAEHNSTQAPKRRSAKVSLLNEEFDLSLFIMILKKRWKLLAIIFGVLLAATAIYLRYAQRVYQESCVIQISSQNTANKVFSSAENMLQSNEDEVAESVELMRSRIFLEKVFKSLPMVVSYYTEGTFKNTERYLTSPYQIEPDSLARKKLANIPVYITFNTVNDGKITFIKGHGPKNAYTFNTGQWCETPYGNLKVHIIKPTEIISSTKNMQKDADFFKINDYTYLSKFYASRINVNASNSDAKTIKISCRDEDDTKAADIANAIGKEYINQVLDKRKESDESILSFINEQLDTIYNRIRQTELKLGDTIRQGNYSGTVVTSGLQSANTEYLITLDEKISNIELEQTQLKELEKKFNEQPNMDPMNLIMQLSISGEGDALKDNITGLHNLINEKQTVSFDATDANLKMQELDSLIKQQKAIIFQSIDLLNGKLETTRNNLITERTDIESKFVTSASVQSLEDLRLKKQASIDEKYYDMLLEKKAEYSIAKAGYVAESEILENAIPNWIPISPQKSVTIIMALLAASAISIIIIVFIYLVYNKITSIYELERLAESPVTILGIIPK